MSVYLQVCAFIYPHHFAIQGSTVVPHSNHNRLQVSTLTALWRSVALNSSPMVLSWMATLLTVLSPGPLRWVESLDRCSVCGSRSGRGPCLWQGSCCASWTKPTAERPNKVCKLYKSCITSSILSSFFLILGLEVFHLSYRASC